MKGKSFPGGGGRNSRQAGKVERGGGPAVGCYGISWYLCMWKKGRAVEVEEKNGLPGEERSLPFCWGEEGSRK